MCSSVDSATAEEGGSGVGEEVSGICVCRQAGGKDQRTA